MTNDERPPKLARVPPHSEAPGGPAQIAALGHKPTQAGLGRSKHILSGVVVMRASSRESQNYGTHYLPGWEYDARRASNQ
jgi:hypothetical protein